jgi:hypothetical protein
MLLGFADRKLKNFPVVPVNNSLLYYSNDGHTWDGKHLKYKQGMRFKEG